MSLADELRGAADEIERTGVDPADFPLWPVLPEPERSQRAAYLRNLADAMDGAPMPEPRR